MKLVNERFTKLSFYWYANILNKANAKIWRKGNKSSSYFLNDYLSSCHCLTESLHYVDVGRYFFQLCARYNHQDNLYCTAVSISI